MPRSPLPPLKLETDFREMRVTEKARTSGRRPQHRAASLAEPGL